MKPKNSISVYVDRPLGLEIKKRAKKEGSFFHPYVNKLLQQALDLLKQADEEKANETKNK